MKGGEKMRKTYTTPSVVNHEVIQFATHMSVDFPGVGYGVGGSPSGGEGTYPGKGKGPSGDVGDGDGHKH